MVASTPSLSTPGPGEGCSPVLQTETLRPEGYLGRQHFARSCWAARAITHDSQALQSDKLLLNSLKKTPFLNLANSVTFQPVFVICTVLPIAPEP